MTTSVSEKPFAWVGTPEYLRSRISSLEKTAAESKPNTDNRYESVQSFCSGAISELRLMLGCMEQA